MAYASTYLTDEEKKKNQEAGVNTSGVVGGTTAGGTASGAAEQQAKTPGTGYVNLQQYLDVNKGAGAQLANTVTQDANKAADTYKSAAEKALEESKNKYSQTVDAASQKAGQLQSGIVQSASQNRDAAKDFLGAGFNGPQAQDFTGGLAADKGRVQSQLSSVADINNQQAALQKNYGKQGNYTQGYGLLDSFLLQGDESGRKQIEATKNRANEVAGTFDSTAQAIAAQEQKAKADFDASKKSIVDTAAQEKAKRENEALRKASVMNTQIAREKREGATNASVADALNDTQLADLQALADIANINADYVRTLNPGRKPEKQAAPQPSSEEGVSFNPTGKRFDANGNEIPPDAGVGVAIPKEVAGKPVPSLPIPTTSTWQAMPVTPPQAPPMRISSADKKKLEKQRKDNLI